MALVQRINPNLIFATRATSQDRPEFSGYEEGWGVTRPDGIPSINQSNFTQKNTDEKVLYIHQSGACLPFNTDMEYVDGAILLKDGKLQQKKGASWIDVLASNVIDNLTSSSKVAALSAAMGKKLNEEKLGKKENAASASVLETPRKINGVDFDGSKDIETPVFGATNGLVPARIDPTSNRFLNENGTWLMTPNTLYSTMSEITMQGGTSRTAQVITAERLKQAIEFWGLSSSQIVRTYKDLVVQGNTDYKNNYSHDIQITVSLNLLGGDSPYARLLIGGNSITMLWISGRYVNLQAWIPSGATWRISLLNGATINPNLSKEYS